MKKIIIILACSCLFSSQANSQAGGKATYKAILATNSCSPIYEKLLFRQGQATYKLDRKEHPDKVTIDEQTGEVSLNFEVPDSVHTTILTDINTGEILSKTYLSNDNGETYNAYYVRETIRLSWAIHNETREIQGHTCQKATAQFRGRDYVAWFSDDIPVTIGPWKFHGLPGLIFEIRDATNEVSFFLDKIEYPHPAAPNMDTSMYKNTISTAQFFELRAIAKEKSRKAFESAILAKLPRGAQIEMTKEGNIEIERSL